MNSFLLFISLLIFSAAHSTIYYFSNTTVYSGSATGDINHPFRNPSAMDSILRGIYPGVTAVPGDQFLFKRGDVFLITSTISPTKSGTTSSPYIIGAYGTGSKPVWTSFQELKNWTSMGGNKYRAQIPGSNTKITSLLLGTTASTGVLQRIGRWPNRDAVSGAADPKSKKTGLNYGGYMDLEDKSTSSSHTYDTLWDSNYTVDMATRPTDNWVGAELAIRTSHFRFNTMPIVSSTLSGSLMTYRFDRNNDNNFDNSWDNALVGWGYFIQNHIACLDQQGEWSYNIAKDSVYIYLVNSPSNYSIQIPTIQRILDFGNQGYYVIDNIAMSGANGNILSGTDKSVNTDVTNCTFSYAGENAIEFMGGGHFIDNNYIEYIHTKGIETYAGNSIITNNTIRNTMPINGMGYNTNAPGTSIDAYGDNVLVEYNKIYNTAYVAIDINNGSNQRVTKNFGDSGNVRLDDGGAMVYTVNQSYTNSYRNKVIDSNISIHSFLPEAYLGLPRIYNYMSNLSAFPFYGDKWTNRWKFLGNIASGAQTAFYINDAFYDTLQDNIIYDFQTNGFRLHNAAVVDATHPLMHDNLGTGNIYHTSTSGTTPASAEMFERATGTPTGYGVFKNQYFVYPFLQNADNYFKANGTRKTWSEWDATYGYDHEKNFFRRANPAGATTANMSKLIYNANKYDSVVHLDNKTWIEPSTGKEYLYDTAVLAPFTGRILIYTAKTVLPLTNVDPVVNLTAPINNATFTAPASILLTATASDVDGSVSSVVFYSGSTPIGTGVLSNGSYTYSWDNVAAGPYALKAVATDNLGGSASSGVSTIIVNTNNSYSSPIDKYKTRGIKFYKKTK